MSSSDSIKYNLLKAKIANHYLEKIIEEYKFS